jgi:hypothetical protein
MTDKEKINVGNAIYKTYTHTEGLSKVGCYAVDVLINTPSCSGGTRTVAIEIAREFVNNDTDVIYKLTIPNWNTPLVITYGCWPIAYVTDIFVRAIDHFFDL